MYYRTTMSGMQDQIRIGTSGWYYDHWRGLFYPQDSPKSKWFDCYSSHFDTVEINNTFYQLPKARTIETWRHRAPESFLYAVKASRYITHVRRLKGAVDGLGRFFETINPLAEHLGPILYQLPPSLRKDLSLLDAFLGLLPEGQSSVFEFRHDSWYEQDVYDLLSGYGAALCIHDMSGAFSDRVVTGRIVYMRFHGIVGKHEGPYSDSTLQEWAGWLKEQARAGLGVYAYFNNDISGYAVEDAGRLRNLISQ